ncbi:MAG: cobyrinate a,c-diamide synthase, partial [Nitrospirota bacterium]
KGPDYIDAGWLSKAAGNPCYNLDLFMMSPEQAFQSFISHTCNIKTFTSQRLIKEDENKLTPSPSSPPVKGGKIITVPSPLAGEGQGEWVFSGQIALIEGNRGLYDGVDHKGTYSTAELAKLLLSPIILIVDSTKATNTIAAMVLGCQKMDPDVLIGGIVLNHVATSRQESLIRKAINDTCNLPVLGAIPRLKSDPFPERHMGLTPFQEHLDIEKSIAVVEEIGEKYIDMDGIWKVANEAGAIRINAGCEMRDADNPPLSPLNLRGDERGVTEIRNPKSEIRIGVIKDSAFQFYYPDNFEELEKRGAKLIEVNALKETEIPDLDALYIGGGFPETHAVALADNNRFKNSIREAVEKGLPVYAECGGLMYLGESLILENKTYPMAGVLPVVFGLEKKPQAHGYTIIEVEKPNPYFSQHIVLKGHEFHYSRVLEINTPLTPLNRGEESPPLKKGNVGGFSEQTYMAFNVRRGKGIIEGKDGLCYKNVLATYTHLHAVGSPEWAEGLIRCAKKFKNQI